jgi:hypothetical protein
VKSKDPGEHKPLKKREDLTHFYVKLDGYIVVRKVELFTYSMKVPQFHQSRSAIYAEQNCRELSDGEPLFDSLNSSLSFTVASLFTKVMR